MVSLLFRGLLIWGMLCGSSMAGDDGPKSIRWDSAFQHERTGIIFPARIGAFEIVSRSRYGTSEFDGDDTGVRYSDGKTKIDVYLYNKGMETLEDDEDHEIILSEISTTLSFIKQSEGKHYFEVAVSDDATVSPFGGNDYAMIRSVMSYREADPELAKTGKKKQRQESSIALTIYSNYLVKIRHSFLMPIDKKELETERKNRDEFQDAVCELIVDTILRPMAEKAVRNFKNDPTDEEARGNVFAYADASDLVHVTIGMDLLPFIKTDDFKGTSSLITAFIAGNIATQWKELDFQSRDFEGVHQMLLTYERLKLKNAVGIDPTLEKWSKLKNDELFQLVEKIVNSEKTKEQ